MSEVGLLGRALERLRGAMAESGVECLLLNDMTNIRWATGFSGSSGAALVTPDSAHFVTDSRYGIQAEGEVVDFTVEVYRSPATLDSVVVERARESGAGRIWFEAGVSYGTYQKRVADFPEVEWVMAPELVTELRKVKSGAEVEKIRAACRLADACFEHVTRMLQPGVREYDIALDIEFFYKRNGAQLAFPPIVASGPNSAKPHARPGERALELGDFLTIDCGADLDGYCSDITRTFVIGRASERHREVYEQVLKAEEACLAACVVGAEGKSVDQLARDILDEKGLAQYFGHGLGHGLGMVVHDPGSLNQRSVDVLKPGMVFTVEPGVYLEGFGGVRIEDDVLVTESGPEVLTSFPKHLMELG